MAKKQPKIPKSRFRIVDAVRKAGFDPAKLAPEQARAMRLAAECRDFSNHFYLFARAAYKHAFEHEFKDNWHVGAICYHLQALWEGKLNDGKTHVLVISCPPGVGKSTWMNVFFSVWCWIRQPSAGQWYASYARDLCERDHMLARRLISSDWFKEHWGHLFEISEDQDNKSRYNNSRGGWRMALAVKSKSGLGWHPTLYGLDDPLSPEEAYSLVARKAVHDYLSNKISTRGHIVGIKIVICGQRLHMEDAHWHIMTLFPDAVHLMIPMEYEPERKCVTKLEYHDVDDLDRQGQPKLKKQWEDPRTEPGELLWPEVMTEKKVGVLKAGLRTEHMISTQLQQLPMASSGDIIKKPWLEHKVKKDAVPASTRICRAWDMATATNSRADFTVGALGCESEGLYYGMDVVRGKWAREERDKIIVQVTERDANKYAGYHVRLEYEGGAGGKDAADILADRLRRICRVEISKPLGKPSKTNYTLRGWEVYVDVLSRFLFRLVEGDWNQEFVDENLAAPFGKDDQIDAMSHVVRALYVKGKSGLNREMLQVTKEEEEELVNKGRLCPQCFGIGCPTCRMAQLQEEMDEIGLLTAGREIGVYW